MNMTRKLLATAAVAVVALAVGTAQAAPTTTIDGVTIPLGIVPLGNVLQSGVLDENLITASGQTLEGVGIVNSISAAGALTPIWSNGANSTELAFFFTGYVSNVSGFPTVSFTGGTVNYYTLPANTVISGLGSFDADKAAIEAGTLWLSTEAAPENAAGDTLISTLTGGSLSTFSAGDGNGFLDITGGAAASVLATGTFANGFDTGGPLSDKPGFSDLTLTSDFTNGAGAPGDGLPVGGSATVKGNALTVPVPEPYSLALLGVGLLGIGVVRGRKSGQR
jgi:hypothetical protein